MAKYKQINSCLCARNIHEICCLYTVDSVQSVADSVNSRILQDIILIPVLPVVLGSGLKLIPKLFPQLNFD